MTDNYWAITGIMQGEYEHFVACDCTLDEAIQAMWKKYYDTEFDEWDQLGLCVIAVFQSNSPILPVPC